MNRESYWERPDRVCLVRRAQLLHLRALHLHAGRGCGDSEETLKIHCRRAGHRDRSRHGFHLSHTSHFMRSYHLPRSFRDTYHLVSQSAVAWLGDGCPRLGAALAYYTVFSLAPTLIIAIGLTGMVFGREAVQGEIVNQINGLIGKQGAVAVQAMIQSAYQSGYASTATGIGVATLLLSASAVFGELTNALNIVWKYKADPGHALLRFVRHKLLSFSLVIGVGFLLMASLIVSAAIEAFNRYFGQAFPTATILLSVSNWVTSTAIITLLFALIFKFVPDIPVRWRDVWLGAIVTALLFNLGKHVIGLYLGNSAVTSPFGAAGSLAVIMIWVYYSAQIMLFGAEFTHVYAEWRAKRGGERGRPPQLAPLDA